MQKTFIKTGRFESTLDDKFNEISKLGATRSANWLMNTTYVFSLYNPQRIQLIIDQDAVVGIVRRVEEPEPIIIKR